MMIILQPMCIFGLFLLTLGAGISYTCVFPLSPTAIDQLTRLPLSQEYHVVVVAAAGAAATAALAAAALAAAAAVAEATAAPLSPCRM